ncbi:hypothetical protein [Streptomyces sp. NBC_01438]|uniref:hypothetical protein n=1 Tax=Streptomyces sp. NBC_01438 TaxID=2903866 RepID=UPI00324558F4
MRAELREREPGLRRGLRPEPHGESGNSGRRTEGRPPRTAWFAHSARLPLPLTVAMVMAMAGEGAR